jgi:L-alanine-DL-glutamate epimerase-like enolase superfamily enzyme
MRISDVETLILRLPATADVGDSSQDLLVVRVLTDEGLVGIGEADTSPEVGRAAIDAPLSHEVCRGLRDVVVGRDPFDRGAVWRAMYLATMFYGRGGAAVQAMSAIDLALWDLMGKATGRPVYQLMGGACQPRIRAYASVLMPAEPAAAEELVRGLVADGFGAVKLGWGGLGRNLRQDEALVAAAMRGAADTAGGDPADIMIDTASHTWRRDFRYVERLAMTLGELGVYWLEDPFAPDDYASYGRLRVPGLRIAAGEEETTPAGFERLFATGGIDVVQPDPSRAGGLTGCLRVAERAESLGVALAPHAWSSPLVRAAALHLCVATPHALMLEFSRNPSPFERLFDTGMEHRDGYLLPVDRPGLGVELDLEAARAFGV